MKHFVKVLFLIILFNSCEIIDNDDSVVEQEEPTISTGLVASSDEEYLNIQSEEMPVGSASSLPPEWDLSMFMPNVGDQRSINSCLAWSIGYYLKSYQEKIEHGYDYTGPNNVMSPPYIYNQIKLYGDCKSGSTFFKAFELLKSQGVCTLEQMPLNGLDCDTQPTNEQKQQAASNKIFDYYRLPNENIVNNIKYYITLGFPIVIGAKVDEAFMNRKGIDYEFVYEGLEDDDFERHAMLIVGYDDEKNAFNVINSWGINWGNDGYCWIKYDLFTDGDDSIFTSSTVYRAFRVIDIIDSNNSSEISLSGDLNFGDVQINQSLTKTMTISNEGTGDLIVSNILNPAGYSSTFSGTIAPGNSQDVTVTFTPTIEQNYDGVITVDSNAGSGTNQIECYGNGISDNVQYGTLEVINSTNYPRHFRIKKQASTDWPETYHTVIPSGQTGYYYNLDIGVYNWEADDIGTFQTYNYFYSSSQVNIQNSTTSVVTIVQ